LLDISRQVFGRSVRMGPSYVILSLIMGVFLTTSLNYAATIGNVVSSSGLGVPLGSILGLLVVPTGALVGLVITTPVYLLFVNDKNAGVLEYLLAVGMTQRDIFMGYLKASLMLSVLAMIPVVVINTAFMGGGLGLSLLGGGLAFVTGISDVALVTILMTSFSSMQRRPTGMNSPIGISIGVFLLIPEFLLIALLGTLIVWVEAGIAIAIFAAAAALMLSINKIIKREKLLP
jgi:5-bromo-4-chloroindolyl phosphate hydrolysis protein